MGFPGLLKTTDAVVGIEGKDARTFLHRLLANDVLGLEVGDGRRSVLLDIKGHVQSDLALLRTGEEQFLAIAPGAAREATVKMLTHYGIADELEVSEKDEVVLTVQGTLDVPGVTSPICFKKELEHTRVSIGGVELRVARHDRSGRGGTDFLVPAASVDAVTKSISVGELSESELDLARLESGIARFGVDFGTETIPQEARLENGALSFDKGCFLGQEVVARIKFRGHVNKLLCGLVLDGEVAPGTALRKSDKDVGKLTSVRSSPLGVIALGYLRREHSTPGTEIDLAGSSHKGRVVELPFRKS